MEYSSESKPKVTVIIANLGTPDEPTVPAVRQFLKQFLSDQRVIEIPKILWQIILNAFILPFRPKRVAHAYASVWSKDSPMREILNEQIGKIQEKLTNQYREFDLNIIPAMTYGNPGLTRALTALASNPQDHIVLFPLFPQYSATSTAPLYDVLSKWMLEQRNIPGLTIIKEYYQHPLYIQALANSVLEFQKKHGTAEKILMSFHGIPIPYAEKGDPYPEHCHITARKVAEKLNLKEDQWAISFQSRFGKQEWVKPYTDQLLKEWGAQGVKSVQILSPAFSADCLETLEELAIQNAEFFKQAGGQDYAYIPALNGRDDHIDLLVTLVQSHLNALKDTLLSE